MVHILVRLTIQIKLKMYSHHIDPSLPPNAFRILLSIIPDQVFYPPPPPKKKKKKNTHPNSKVSNAFMCINPLIYLILPLISPI